MQTEHSVPPAGYLQLTPAQLLDKVEEGLNRLENCRLCPRQCDVNRVEGNTGFCQTGRRSRLASFQLHFGEEAPLVGNQGSGRLFFSGCNLGCVFCQNVDISREEYEQTLHLAKSYGLTRLDQRNQRSLQALFRRLQ